MKSFWETYIYPIQNHFRSRRVNFYLDILPDFKDKKVIDVGGSYYFWQQCKELRPKDLTLININTFDPVHNVTGDAYQVKSVHYDGTRLPFEDNHFDVAFSNSVIEHVPVEMRENFVNEMRRVAKNYFIQTPAYAFPLEMHFFTPFFHWLPRSLGRLLAPFTLYRLLMKTDAAKCYELYDEVNILKKSELNGYDKTMNIKVETVFGYPKSYVGYGKGVNA